MKVLSYKYKANIVCSRCIMDDTVPGITFDENGVIFINYIRNLKKDFH